MKRPISVNLPDNIVRLLDKIADDEGISRSWIITKVIEGWFAERPFDAQLGLPPAAVGARVPKCGRRRNPLAFTFGNMIAAEDIPPRPAGWVGNRD